MTRRLAPILLAPVLLLALQACVVGPRYVRPDVAASPAWMEPQPPGAPDERWWRGFGDPQLEALIEQAQAASPDLRAADARLAEARAARDLARGGALPHGGAEAAYSRNRVSANGEIPIGRIPGFSRDFSLFDGGFDASWEVDLWGRQKRAIEAAGARLEAAREARREALIRLRAEVARAYLELRAAQAGADSAADEARADERLADVAAERLRAGEAGQGEFARATAQARAAAAAVPGFEADERQALGALATLLGRPPEALAPALAAHRPIPQPAAVLGPGLRSDVLRRRPDVAVAERNLAAATADIGVATADLFPRLTLAGAIGQQSQSLADIALAGSTTFQAGPALAWPILQRGSIRANIRAADARAQAAGAAYEGAVFAALADSETALSRAERARAALADAQAAFDAAGEARAVAQRRYQAGEDDLAAVLTAEAAEAQALGRLTAARLARAEAVVAAYKSLGL